jgi:hypothetical protein
MEKINVGRWILGGIIAGVVADVLGTLVDSVLLAEWWTNGMKALGHSGFSLNQWIGFNVLGLITGIVAIWIYAGIRPRFGPGPMTAIYAGLAVWVVGTLVPNLSFMVFGGLFSKHLAMYTTLGGVVEIVVGTVAGAALYKEA